MTRQTIALNGTDGISQISGRGVSVSGGAGVSQADSKDTRSPLRSDCGVAAAPARSAAAGAQPSPRPQAVQQPVPMSIASVRGLIGSCQSIQPALF